MGCALHGPECDYRTHKCEKCGEQAVNFWFTLCHTHTDELIQAKLDKQLERVNDLKARGTICDPEECYHENVEFDHCFDCGRDDELEICSRCKEWTGILNPCC